MNEDIKTSVNPINKLQISIGVVFLVIGSLVYLIDRPPESTYFVYRYLPILNLHNILPNIFGSLDGSLPDFVHVFSFILITAGILTCGKRGYLIVCCSWLLIDCAFKLGQKYPSLALKMIPAWFSSIPILEAAKGYFHKGTWDINDIIAMFLGAAIAYFVLLITMKKGEGHEKKQPSTIKTVP
jgi:hypothetical protein